MRSALLLAAAVLVVAVDTPDPSCWVVPADRPAFLPVRTPTAMAWRMLDARGREEAAGTVAADAAEGTVAVTPAEGWHEVVFADGSRLGLVAGTAAPEADPFFAIDAASDWLVEDDVRRAALAGMVRRLGLAMVRERVAWGRLQPGRDGLAAAAVEHSDRVRAQWADAGLPVLECFHDAPAWLGRSSGAYPADLAAVAASWGILGRRWPATAAIEVWNEPDAPLFSGGGVVEHLVALHHALAWGLHAGGARVQLGGGVLTGFEPASFRAALWANGIAAASDFISFHDYRDPRGLEGHVATLRRELAAAGDAAVPLWLSESGKPWPGGGRPARDADIASAVAIMARAAEARACGVARHFAFVLPAYAERDDNFGLTGRDGTPLLALAAYAHLARRLAGLPYVGDLAAGDALRARVFADATRAVAVVWLGAAAGARRWLPPVAPRAAFAIDGRRLIADADGGWPAEEGVVVAEFATPGLAPHLNRDTVATRLLAQARAMRQPRPPPSPLVLQPVAVAERFLPRFDGWRLEGGAGSSAIAVRLWNLAAEACRVRLVLEGPAGAKPLDGPERTTEAAAGSAVDLRWRVEPGVAGTWTVTASSSAGAARLALTTVRETDGMAILAGLPPDRRREIPAAAWVAAEPAAVAGAECRIVAAADGSARIALRFPPGVDRWAYPRVATPGGLAAVDALLVRLRCARPAAVRLIAQVGAAGWLTPGTLVEADGQWHWAVVRLAELQPCLAMPPDPHGVFAPAAVTSLSLGMNSDADENSLDIDRCHLVRLDAP